MFPEVTTDYFYLCLPNVPTDYLYLMLPPNLSTYYFYLMLLPHFLTYYFYLLLQLFCQKADIVLNTRKLELRISCVRYVLSTVMWNKESPHMGEGKQKRQLYELEKCKEKIRSRAFNNNMKKKRFTTEICDWIRKALFRQGSVAQGDWTWGEGLRFVRGSCTFKFSEGYKEHGR